MYLLFLTTSSSAKDINLFKFFEGKIDIRSFRLSMNIAFNLTFATELIK